MDYRHKPRRRGPFWTPIGGPFCVPIDMYAIEATIRGQSPEARQAVRQAHSAPLFSDLRTWLETTQSRISGKSELAGAIRYMLSRWNALTLVLRDGRACIDNNAAERAMRPIPLGRKNWLHAGSDAGGGRAGGQQRSSR
jgi:transposase